MNELNNIHEVRVKYEEPVFSFLKEKYGSMLKEFWETATFPNYKDCSNIILLVERREHPNIEFVLQNAMYYCREKQFGLTIVCSDISMEYVKGILGKHADTSLVIPWFKGIGTRDQGRDEYNKTFLTPEFWRQIPGEYILSIQTDSYLRKPIPDCMWNYEYVASPWSWDLRFVGGGGLTWRKKEIILEILELNLPKTKGEDVFFAYGCEALDVKVPDDKIRYELFVESHFQELNGKITDPFGVHQWWTYVMRLPDKTLSDKLFKLYTNCEV